MNNNHQRSFRLDCIYLVFNIPARFRFNFNSPSYMTSSLTLIFFCLFIFCSDLIEIKKREKKSKIQFHISILYICLMRLGTTQKVELLTNSYPLIMRSKKKEKEKEE